MLKTNKNSLNFSAAEHEHDFFLSFREIRTRDFPLPLSWAVNYTSFPRVAERAWVRPGELTNWHLLSEFITLELPGNCCSRKRDLHQPGLGGKRSLGENKVDTESCRRKGSEKES
jgi:hypothetical protein